MSIRQSNIRWTLGAIVLLSLGVFTQPASAQVIMLPQYQVFNIGTSVWVPDRGMIELGRVMNAADGRVSRGFPGYSNTAIGREASVSQIIMKVWIHDLKAMDQALLRIGEELYGRKSDPVVDKKADFLNRNAGRSSSASDRFKSSTFRSPFPQ